MKKILLFLIPCMGILLGPRMVEGANEKPIRLGYLQSDIHHLACWVALEKGFFRNEGLHVEVAGVFRAGPEEMSAFAAGDLDVGYVGQAPATTAVANKTAEVTVLAQANTEGSSIIVRKDSSVQGLKDLAGKSIAIPGHSTVQDFLLQKALLAVDIGVRDARVMVLKPPEMTGALMQNQIHAFIAWEPYGAKACTMNAGRVLVTSREIWKDHPCCVFLAENKFLRNRPAEAKGMLRAHLKATDFIYSEKEEAVKIAVKYTGMDEGTIRLAMDNVRYTYRINTDGEKEYVQFLHRMKYINVDDINAFIAKFMNAGILKEIIYP